MWRYCFALSTCAAAIGTEALLDRVTGDPPHPFAISLFAIVASTLWAGAVPSLVATCVLIAWSAFYSVSHGFSGPSTVGRSVVFLVLSVGASRMWDRLRDVRSSETLHRRLVEAAGEGIWVHDERGVITYANDRLAKMLGLRVEELIGRKTEEFFVPEDAATERVRAANLRDRTHTQFDRRLRCVDGTEIWVMTCSSQIGSRSLLGRKPEALAIMADITQRKQAESALRQSEERFRSLFEGIPGGFAQTTHEGRVLWANPALVEMLGFASEEELRKVDIARDLFVDPQVRARLVGQLEREGSYRKARFELRRRDGGIITVLANARVVRDRDGAVLHYEAVLTDITEDKNESALAGTRDASCGETIMLVETDPLVRELCRDMLERQGYRVILAANAEEAGRISARARHFDLLITAACIEDMTGAELASRLREKNPQLQALYIGDSTDGRAFLGKPFSAEALGRKVREVLG
jgi:PAS domain S-box-containing protein